MFEFLIIPIGFLIWLFIGALFFASIDKDGKVGEWVDASPLGTWFPLFIWPVFLVMYLVNKKK